MEQTQEKGFFARNIKWLVVLAVVVLLAFWAVGVRNGFVVKGEAITGQWAQVESQYQRRFDLIPNIVNTVKGVAAQETAVFTAIADARTKYSGATTPDQKAQAATQVEGALGRLLVIAEAYPTLQSSQAYRDLVVSLEGTENRIAVERMKYNDLVRGFNTSVKVFPSSLVAMIFGINEKAYFDVAEGVQNAPVVDFTN